MLFSPGKIQFHRIKHLANETNPYETNANEIWEYWTPKVQLRLELPTIQSIHLLDASLPACWTCHSLPTLHFHTNIRLKLTLILITQQSLHVLHENENENENYFVFGFQSLIDQVRIDSNELQVTEWNGTQSRIDFRTWMKSDKEKWNPIANVSRRRAFSLPNEKQKSNRTMQRRHSLDRYCKSMIPFVAAKRQHQKSQSLTQPSPHLNAPIPLMKRTDTWR